MELLEQNHCHPKEELGDCVGKVLALDSNLLLPQAKHLESQLWLATHGKGCYEGYHDTTIHVTSLFDQTETYFMREQFLGEVKEEVLPTYAKNMRDLLRPLCHDEAFYLRARAIPFDTYQESRILSQYENTVLTVNLTPEKEVTFSVYNYDEEKEILDSGIGYGVNLELAKGDFAVRSGLVQEDLLLNQGQKNLLMRSLDYALEEGMELDYDEEDIIVEWNRENEELEGDCER